MSAQTETASSHQTIVLDIGRVTRPVESFHVKILSQDNIDIDPTASNGVAPSPAARASPGPQVPNGKPTVPAGAPPQAPPQAPINNGPQSVTAKTPKEAAAAALDTKNIVRRKLTGFVGFANLPNQWHRKSVRKGFNFNVMVVGK